MCGLHRQASSLSGGLLPSRHTVLSLSGFLGPLTALPCWPWGAEGPQGCCIILWGFPALCLHLCKSSLIDSLLLLLSNFSRVRLCATHRRQPTRLLCPWDSPGKNTGVGCRFLLQCMKVKSESEVAQSCPTLCDPMDCSLPGSSIYGIFQAKVLEWGAIAFSETVCR